MPFSLRWSLVGLTAKRFRPPCVAPPCGRTPHSPGDTSVTVPVAEPWFTNPRIQILGLVEQLVNSLFSYTNRILRTSYSSYDSYHDPIRVVLRPPRSDRYMALLPGSGLPCGNRALFAFGSPSVRLRPYWSIYCYMRSVFDVSI